MLTSGVSKGIGATSDGSRSVWMCCSLGHERHLPLPAASAATKTRPDPFYYEVTHAMICLVAPTLAQAQGLLVDVRPDHRYRLPRPILIRPPHTVPQPETRSYAIKELTVHATLNGQVAKVQVAQTFVNTGKRQIEASFLFPLPMMELSIP